jgi:hypothetical protein
MTSSSATSSHPADCSRESAVRCWWKKLVERQVNLDDFVEYSQIVIRIQGNTPEQQEENTPTAEAKAQEAYQKIKEGLDFAEAVKEYSEDPFSKDRGGKMNWQNINFIVPDLRQKLQAMQPGEISEPFKMMGSYMIIRKERTGGRKPRPKSSRSCASKPCACRSASMCASCSLRRRSRTLSYSHLTRRLPRRQAVRADPVRPPRPAPPR